MGAPGGNSTPGPRCSVEGEADMAVQGVDTTLFWRHGPVQTDHDAQRVATRAAGDLLRIEEATPWELKPKLLHMVVCRKCPALQRTRADISQALTYP